MIENNEDNDAFRVNRFYGETNTEFKDFYSILPPEDAKKLLGKEKGIKRLAKKIKRK